jgi:hypothetical protein
LKTLPARLPLTEVAAATAWWRVHRSARGPVFFGPAPGDPPTNRFDAPNGQYRTLYLGESFAGAFVETLLRVPRLPYVQRAELEERSASRLDNEAVLRLVDLRGPGLSKIGVDNSLTTCTYDVSGQWALALWQHKDQPDGLLYRSRHDPHHTCAAIFDREHCHFSIQETLPLMSIPKRWASVLVAHGKGIA